LKKALKQIGIVGIPTDENLLKGFCVEQAIENELEKCAKKIIEVNGLPAGYNDYNDYYG